jgi:hypothetical protein
LELLSLQLPVGASDDQDRNDVAALRADITALITAITIGLSDPTERGLPALWVRRLAR